MYNEEKYFDTEKMLDEALKAEPKFILSDNFADVLAEKMGRRFAWEQYFREFLIYLGSIFGLLAVPLVLQFVLFDANLLKWVQVAVANILPITGIIVLVVFILFVDRVLLRYFFYRSAVEVH